MKQDEILLRSVEASLAVYAGRAENGSLVLMSDTTNWLRNLLECREILEARIPPERVDPFDCQPLNGQDNQS